MATDAYATYTAYWAALAEAGNLCDPELSADDAGYDRAEARMDAAAQGVQYVDELDADDWDDAYPF